MSRTMKDCPIGHADSAMVIGGPGTTGGPKYWAGCRICNWRAWGDTEDEAITVWNDRGQGDV